MRSLCHQYIEKWAMTLGFRYKIKNHRRCDIHKLWIIGFYIRVGIVKDIQLLQGNLG